MSSKHAHSANPETIKGLARLVQQFMTPAIWNGDCWEVSANHGETYYVDAGVAGSDPSCLADYVEGTIDTDDDGKPSAELRRDVYLCQLSASGYMDQTDLAVFDTLAEAEDYLVETYDDGDDEQDDDLPYCAECDAPFSPDESGYSTVCGVECATKRELRIGGLDE
jgi:hypothetical protein